MHVCDSILQVAVHDLTEEEEEKERTQKMVVKMLKQVQQFGWHCRRF
jgi:hypothetical protein